MCNCREKIERALAERHAEHNPSETEHAAVLTGYGLALTNDMEMYARPFMLVELRSTAKNKKTGGARVKTKKTRVFFTHCPFCGKELTN